MPEDLKPRPGHVVVVSEIPTCDMCGQCEADWDAPTIYGAWANLCDRCNHLYARYPGQTGVGIGQRLILPEDVA